MSRFIHQSQQLGIPYPAIAHSDQYIPGMTRSPNSCMQLEVTAGSIAITEQWNTRPLNKGNGRGSISMDVKAGPLYTEVSLSIFLKYGNITCGLTDFVGNVVAYAVNGTTSAPITSATKCWTAAGEMVVLSMTTVRFCSGAGSVYHAATSLIGETALFRETEQAMLNATHATNTTTVGFIEYMADGPSVEIAGCLRGLGFLTNVSIAICSYSTASIIIAKSHQFNSTISARFGKALSGNAITTIAAIKHLPTNHTLVPFDLHDASYLAYVY
ncbi:hypothetical protein BG015_005062 [Linnemannia schmuckeri]|uniref:Uncharacterized protein n=1 Tax=Linnemannia schmuckeri TaxID=64567 RepID=A0A9P5S3V8_9FUNG|nr:hypothetical protein BG015_005062 [Linnemannia schmuckeri]